MDEIEFALLSFQTYTEKHFPREEFLHQETEYPEAQAQIEDHLRLAEQVAELSRRCLGSTNPAHATEVMNLIYDWLTNHVYVADRDFDAYRRGKRIQFD